MAGFWGFLVIPAGCMLVGFMFLILAFSLGNAIGYISLEIGSAIPLFIMYHYLLIAIFMSFVIFIWFFFNRKYEKR